MVAILIWLGAAAHVVVEVVSARHLPRRPGFDPIPIRVEFVVDKVALGQAFPLPVQFRQCSFALIRFSATDDVL